MTARLPIPTPDQLVRQWSRKLRGVAYDTGVDYDDVRQTAWLVAAEMLAKGREVEIGAWHSAVHTQVLTQRDGINRYPNDDEPGAYIGVGWLLGGSDGFDDPARAAEAAEAVARRVGGEHGDDTVRWQRIRQEIELPRTAAEIAQARGVSERQGRRDAAKMRTLEAAQAGLFDAEVTV
ncbi:MAG: hypothetical protein ACYCWA_00265 [Thiobacillus sp.]